MTKSADQPPIEQKNDAALQYKALAVGIILFATLLGISLIAKLFSFETVDQYWPVLIIAAGFVLLNSSSSTAPSGILVMLLGIVIISSKMGWLNGTSGHVVEIFTLLVLALVLLLMGSSKTTK